MALRGRVDVLPIIAYLYTYQGLFKINDDDAPSQIYMMATERSKHIFIPPSRRRGLLIVMSAINNTGFPKDLMDVGRWACRSVRDIRFRGESLKDNPAFVAGNPLLVLVCGHQIPAEQSLREQRDLKIKWRFSYLGSDS